MLEYKKIKHVLLPVYICDSVYHAVVDAHASVQWYTLDNSLYPKGLPNPLPDDSAVLYVNYYGLCDSVVRRLTLDIPKQRLIIDNSQALFSPHEDVLATVYSIRKFMGVPDGGLLAIDEAEFKLPDSEDAVSIERIRALLLRTAYPASSGYESYVKAENSLSDTRPVRMSRLTNRLMASVDIDALKMKRRKNFSALARRLDKFNKQSWHLEASSVPLCYPLLANRYAGELREELISKGVYTPNYWAEVKVRAANNSFEHQLSYNCIFLPCDQRYTPAQMDSIAEEVIALLHDTA